MMELMGANPFLGIIAGFVFGIAVVQLSILAITAWRRH